MIPILPERTNIEIKCLLAILNTTKALAVLYFNICTNPDY
jgi:hypothetical protein